MSNSERNPVSGRGWGANRLELVYYTESMNSEIYFLSQQKSCKQTPKVF